jgi:hypothetical protein
LGSPQLIDYKQRLSNQIAFISFRLSLSFRRAKEIKKKDRSTGGAMIHLMKRMKCSASRTLAPLSRKLATRKCVRHAAHWKHLRNAQTPKETQFSDLWTLEEGKKKKTTTKQTGKACAELKGEGK